MKVKVCPYSRVRALGPVLMFLRLQASNDAAAVNLQGVSEKQNQQKNHDFLKIPKNISIKIAVRIQHILPHLSDDRF